MRFKGWKIRAVMDVFGESSRRLEREGRFFAWNLFWLQIKRILKTLLVQ